MGRVGKSLLRASLPKEGAAHQLRGRAPGGQAGVRSAGTSASRALERA